jgi:hypothetical protein
MCTQFHKSLWFIASINPHDDDQVSDGSWGSSLMRDEVNDCFVRREDINKLSFLRDFVPYALSMENMIEPCEKACAKFWRVKQYRIGNATLYACMRASCQRLGLQRSQLDRFAFSKKIGS